MSTFACYSSKGGVGKTSSAVNLAYASSAEGYRTLLIDLDQQGASSFYFRVRAPEKLSAKKLVEGAQSIHSAVRETDYQHLHILPAHVSYRNFDKFLDGMKRSKRRLADLVDEVGDGYDHIFLDCPPTLSLVAENIFRAADKILVPVVPTTLSMRTYEQLKSFFDAGGYKRKKLAPFFSMVEARKRLHKQTMAALRDADSRVLENVIPYLAAIEDMGEKREPVLATSPKHRASLCFSKLWTEVEAL